MQATALTLTLSGLDAQLVRVEVDSGRGPTAFQLVGLAEASVREARVRVRAALAQIGVFLDEYVLTVNLAPADLPKKGGAFDAAIACGCVAALGKIPRERLESLVLLGELSLSGELRPVRGVLPALRGALARGLRRAVVPRANAEEAALVGGIDVVAASHLEELVDHLRGGSGLPAVASFARPARPEPPALDLDLSDVRGQHAGKRALEIAAAGSHALLFVGPPGSGKTMLARRLPGILPPPTEEESLEITAIHSVAGLLPPGAGLVSGRPFRAPHHTASAPALVGGGDPVRPGEVSLAHGGCLFLDELFEFKRQVLDALRQPLEDGTITVSRARARATFPARPLLVAAANPCPCGFAGDPRCACSSERVLAYRARLSGPLLERIDLHVALPAVPFSELGRSRAGGGEGSSAVRERVRAARQAQAGRVARGEARARTNAELEGRELERVATPDEAGMRLIASAVERLGLSARAYAKVLRVARTVADLEGAGAVRAAHVAEAIQLRLLDRSIGTGREAARATGGA